MSGKLFSERLNKELNAYGYPQEQDGRINAFSKVFKVSKYTSASILNGTIQPGNTLLHKISQELEVLSEWLTGESNTKN